MATARTSARSGTATQALTELASIIPGTLIPGKIEDMEDGTHRILTMANVRRGVWDYRAGGDPLRSLPRVKPDKYANEKRTRRGRPRLEWPEVEAADVLIATRGARFDAMLVRSIDKSAKVVPNTTVCIVRLDTTPLLDPGYLAWYLNSQEVQDFLHAMARGSGISLLRKPALENLAIPLPPHDIQKRIGALFTDCCEESRLTHEYLRNKETMLNEVCRRAAERGGRD